MSSAGCWGAEVGKKPLYFDQAEDLYVVDGLTLEQVSARLPEKVSITTLSRWKQDGEWDERRQEWAKAQGEIKRDSLKLRQKLVARALAIMEEDNPGPQELYAASAIASRLGRVEGQGAAADKPAPEIDRPALFLEDLKFVAKVLKETDPEGLKVVARNFEAIVARFKAAHAQAS